MTHDLVVVGAGLSGCAFVRRLHQLGWTGSLAMVEAGRGPGGRSASRLRRGDSDWCLDHGAPGFNLLDPHEPKVAALLEPLRASGVLRREWGDCLGVDEEGEVVSCPDHSFLSGEQLRGYPSMAGVCQALLDGVGAWVEIRFGQRVAKLNWDGLTWSLLDEAGALLLQARSLVLSGSLLAHPRGMALLHWDDVPLRAAVAEGQDPALDRALACIARSTAALRWNLMLELPALAAQDALPRQIWLTAAAQRRWSIERLVLHPQSDGRVGLVVHGLDHRADGELDVSSLPGADRELRLQKGLTTLLRSWPCLAHALDQAIVLGLMRWGASTPLSHPLPSEWQWCPISSVGFCGDWIEGPGFGRAEGALRSAADLADRLQAAR